MVENRYFDMAGERLKISILFFFNCGTMDISYFYVEKTSVRNSRSATAFGFNVPLRGIIDIPEFHGIEECDSFIA